MCNYLIILSKGGVINKKCLWIENYEKADVEGV